MILVITLVSVVQAPVVIFHILEQTLKRTFCQTNLSYPFNNVLQYNSVMLLIYSIAFAL
jgi:hypothetical protein